MSIAVLSSCSSSKSDPANQAPNGTPLPPGFESSADESIYDISNFEILEKDSPEYMKFVKENLGYQYRRKVQDIKKLNGLENIIESKMYYSFGTLVTQYKDQLSLSAQDTNKFVNSSHIISILLNNQSLLKGTNFLISTVDAEVQTDSYNNNENVYQLLGYDYKSYKDDYTNLENHADINIYQKWTSLYEAELKKYPFINCKETTSSSDDNSFSLEFYKHKTIANLYYTKTKTQGITKCVDENNSYDIGKTVETNINISYFAHDSWFDKNIYSESKTEYLDHNYTSRSINKALKKSY